MKRKHTSFKRAALRLLCTVLAVILVMMLSVTFYFQHLLGQINYVDPENSVTLSQEQLDAYLEEEGAASDPAGAATENVEFEEHSTEIGGKGSNLVNILLIGQDRREGESRARSDSMILCSFNTKTKTITMTSILRDLYVEIPGYQNNRINASYAAGGMSLLNQTLEENFGIHVDGNVEVDFSQFSQIIDLLGGVTIELRQDEAELINKETYSSLSSGSQLLTGEQALTYARIRKLDADGDFSRTNRQRKVLNALVAAYKDSGITTILSMLDDILPMVTTDMSKLEIITYAIALFPMLSGSEISSQRIPADGTYENRMVNGMSVLVADMDANRQMLQETLLGNRN